MSISKIKFGEKDGMEVFLYTLDNEKGLTAEILNYGGIIRRLVYKGTDMVSGRDTLEEYFLNEGYFGAIIGRNSNRIEGAEFELSEKTYKLYANDGNNNLHGGKEGFDKKVWEAEAVDSENPSLILKLESPDGEEGFPGNVSVKVTYTVTADNSLKIHYEGIADADTVINLTNHSYFNLNGHASGTVDGHTLYLASEFYTPNTDECMPCGEVLKTAGTPFDFTGKKTLGSAFESDHEQIRMFGGIDHNFALLGSGYRLGAVLTGDKTGIEMQMYTDRPAVQIYTGNAIEQGRCCKDGAFYPTHGAICLETQAFPNSLKHLHFPGAVVKKGEKYDTVTEYKFV